MKVMSTPYETGGRSAQKARTRDALVAAARDLVAAGDTPTVENAAAAASISRSTAYRYFPNERALLLAAHPEIAATSMLCMRDWTKPPSIKSHGQTSSSSCVCITRCMARSLELGTKDCSAQKSKTVFTYTNWLTHWIWSGPALRTY